MGSFLGFKLYNFMKLDLCISEQDLVWDVDSSVHALDLTEFFLIYTSNIANSDSVGEKSNFSAWHSKSASEFIAWEGITLRVTSFNA